MNDTALPWQREPEGDWAQWSITGGRGTGKTWALRNAAIGRAYAGEGVVYVPHSREMIRWTTNELMETVVQDWDLHPEEDVQVSLLPDRGQISFRSGGWILVATRLESGETTTATTVFADLLDPERTIPVPLRGVVRVAVTLRDAP
jgi:hypothetical protein